MGRFNTARRLGQDWTTSYAAPLADLDGDGDLDVVVGNDDVPNQVFWNDGRGRFTPGPNVGPEDSNTRDITLAFGSRGGVLYAAQLEGSLSVVGGQLCPSEFSLAPEDEVFNQGEDCLPQYAPRMVFQRKPDLTSNGLALLI